MHSITELKNKEGNSTGLIAVKVPKDAKAFEIDADGDLCYLHNGNFTGKIHVGFTHSILGLCTADTIGFDAALTIPFFDKLEEFKGYPNYQRFTTIKENGSITVSLFNDAGDSLRSLLAVNNLYWELEPMPNALNYPHQKEVFLEVMANWRTRKSSLLGDNNLLILRKLT